MKSFLRTTFCVMIGTLVIATIAGAEGELAANHTPQFNNVFELIHGGQNHAREFDLTHAECAALAGGTKPAEEKTQHLPQGVEPEAAGHDRVALEVAGEEPIIRLNVELGYDAAVAMLTACFLDVGDAVEHEHRRQRKLSVSGAKQFPSSAGEQSLVLEAGLPFGRGFLHSRRSLLSLWLSA